MPRVGLGPGLEPRKRLLDAADVDSELRGRALGRGAAPVGLGGAQADVERLDKDVILRQAKLKKY